jgi:hypothetical protein
MQVFQTDGTPPKKQDVLAQDELDLEEENGAQENRQCVC